MIALLAAAALAATDAPADAGGPDIPAVEKMITQSCGERSYATYDDVCNILKDQLKVLRKEAAARQRADERARRVSAKAKVAAVGGATDAAPKAP